MAAAMAGLPYTTACSPNTMTFPGADTIKAGAIGDDVFRFIAFFGFPTPLGRDSVAAAGAAGEGEKAGRVSAMPLVVAIGVLKLIRRPFTEPFLGLRNSVWRSLSCKISTLPYFLRLRTRPLSIAMGKRRCTEGRGRDQLCVRGDLK